MKRQIKNAIYLQLSRTTKALCHPKRIEILDLLSQGDKTVETIAEQAGLGIKNASAQLKELKSALLVDSRKVGKFVYYKLANQKTETFLNDLRKFGIEQFVELQKITHEAFASDEELDDVNRNELFSRAKRGQILLIDVRPFDEYSHGHLKYALSIPLNELSKKLKNLPKDKEIIAYCRGPYCFFAQEAVALLRKKGFKAKRLKDSVFEWASHGLPVIREAEAL